MSRADEVAAAERADVPAVRVRGLRKAFGSEGILDGVDLDVQEGELLALLGPNGVGKTVLLSCMAGSTRPSAGTVEVFGTPVREAPGEYASLMLQEAMAVDSLTGRENIEFYGRLQPRFTDRWERYVADFGIAEDLDKRVANYSGGMTRKLELAITLSVDVPIYLLDEPTAGVDLSMIQRVHDAVLDLKEAGRTFVLTSHLPADAELADRIAFVPDGTIGATGPPEALLDAVPSVLRVSGTRTAAAVEPFVVGERLFRVGAEARGFLAPDTDLDAVRAAVGADTFVEATRPNYTDLFNYYVHVEP